VNHYHVFVLELSDNMIVPRECACAKVILPVHIGIGYNHHGERLRYRIVLNKITIQSLRQGRQ
jgi:hypothetical protein